MKIFLVVLVASVTNCQNFPFLVPDLEEPSDCDAVGPMCETCRTSVFCLKTENGTFEKIDRLTCGEGETCSDDSKKCSTDEPHSWCNNPLPFVCGSTPGLYPDPIDWTKYVICAPQLRNNQVVNVPIPLRCPDGFCFNSSTSLCSIPYDCSSNLPYWYPLPECTSNTPPMANFLNKRYFFVCGRYSSTNNELYPFQDICPEGGEFHNGRCISQTECPPTTTYPPGYWTSTTYIPL